MAPDGNARLAHAGAAWPLYRILLALARNPLAVLGA
jgi:hypothetical protein